MSKSRLIPADLLERARNMRHEPAPAEAILWRSLRNRALGGYKFRRQKPVPPFIADFCCIELQLIVELDGDSHSERVTYDGRRTFRLERDGHTVLRFDNADIFENLTVVLDNILAECERLDARNHPHPNPLPAYRERGPDSGQMTA
jgi:adenine-specific DNA-methyltransferase